MAFAVPGDVLAGDRLYTRDFFLSLAAALTFMTGQSLMFHFSRYVVSLGGTDEDVGKVVGAGFAAVIIARPWMGAWVDKFGTTRLWMVGLLLYAISTPANLLVTQVGPALMALRVVWNLGWGLIFVCATAYPAQIAPPHRRAEAVGTQGLGGFFGILVGPWLGDQLLALPTEVRFHWLFGCVAFTSVLAAILVSLLKPAPVESKLMPKQSPILDMFRFWPGSISLIGVALGLNFALTMNFVARHSDTFHIGAVGPFFAVYALAAASVRIFLRRLPENLGRRKTMLLGVVAALAGYQTFGLVHGPLDYAWPGALLGFSHGFIFPSMIDLAGENLPAQRRGLGTSIILGCQETGMFLGPVGMGVLIERFGFPMMFDALFLFVFAAALYYSYGAWRDRRLRGAPSP